MGVENMLQELLIGDVPEDPHDLVRVVSLVPGDRQDARNDSNWEDCHDLVLV